MSMLTGFSLLKNGVFSFPLALFNNTHYFVGFNSGARPASRDDRDAAAGHQHGHRALARADGAHVAQGERAATPRELGGRERTGDLPPEVREVFQR
jgi:hypothetical protein